KNFVLVHGYNVNPDHARGNFADIFKRLYWSGSHAKFYGVSWRGNEIQGKLAHIRFLPPNYHTNVVNSFLTAPHLANFLATLTNGETIVAGHSLGNMVVLSTLNDSTNVGFNVNKYFMIDAAVPLEAIDDTAAQSLDMIHPEWTAPA